VSASAIAAFGEPPPDSIFFQMSFLFEGNLSSLSFTPRDYQVELLSAAKERNVIICLSQNTSKEFCALKLIQEQATELRLNGPEKKVALFLTSSPSAFNLIYYLTDLKVINLNEQRDEQIDWETLADNQVIVLETNRCLDALECSYLDLNSVNLIILDDCHRRTRKSDLTEIFLNHYRKATDKPKIFGLAGPIHNAGCPAARLGAELEHLELLMAAKAETASDIVTVLRFDVFPIRLTLRC